MADQTTDDDGISAGRIIAPADCVTKDDIRQQIDRLDRELMDLFQQRLGYVTRMVDLKKAEGLPGRIPWRVDAVVDHVRELAEAKGLDGDLFADMWRQMVDWNIDYEDQLLPKQTSDSDPGSKE